MGRVLYARDAARGRPVNRITGVDPSHASATGSYRERRGAVQLVLDCSACGPTSHGRGTREKSAPQHTIRHSRSTTTKLAAVFIGALAGFYVGGHIGAALDEGGGDSPGMAGLMYGACIGTGAGAVIGWKLGR